MYQLYVLPAGFGEPSVGPFGVKVLALLRMAGQAYELTYQANPGPMPRGKLPVLDHNGTKIADSDEIRDFLETEHGIDFDEGLTGLQRAQSRAIIRLAEEHLYFAIVADRWQWDDHCGPTLAALGASMPPVIGKLLVGFARRAVIGSLKGQGIGRLTKEEQTARAAKDLDALATLLGDQAYLFGDTPSAADASVIPMLGSINSFEISTLLRRELRARAPLLDYLDRGKAALYPA